MNLPKDFKKELFQNLKALILILILYYVTTWFTGCPIRYFLGISCPGCGMTRAWLSVLHLDFAGAFSYHPLFLLGPLVIVAILFHPWINFHKYRWLIAFIIILFVGVYFIRLIWFPDAIVNLNISEGVIYKRIYQLNEVIGTYF